MIGLIKKIFSGVFSGIINTISGYDYFISYSWRDPDQLGRNYALALKNQLTDEGFACFLDSTDYEKGEDWKEIGKIALSRTRKLLLVATPAIFDSEPVLREIRLFRKTGRQIIAVDIGKTLHNAPRGSELIELIPGTRLHISEAREDARDGPSDSVIRDIRDSFRLTRRKTMRSRIVWAVIVVLATTTAYALIQRQEAVRRANMASSRYLAQQSRALMTTRPSLAQLLSVESYRAYPTEEALGSLIDASNAYPAVRRMLQIPEQELRTGVLREDGRMVALSTRQGKVLLWDPDSGKVTLELANDPTRNATHLALSADGRWLASAIDNGTVLEAKAPSTVELWDLRRDPPRRRELSIPANAIYSLVFDPRSRRLAISDWNGVIHLQGLDDLSSLPLLLSRHKSLIHSLVFSPDGRYLVSGSGDGTARVWDTDTGTQIRKVEPYLQTPKDPRKPVPESWVASAGDAFVSSVSINTDGSQIMTLSSEGDLLTWDVATGSRVQQRLFAPIRGAKRNLSPDGTSLLAVQEKDIVEWDVASERAQSEQASGVWAIPHGLWLFDGPRGAPGARRLLIVADTIAALVELDGHRSDRDVLCRFSALENRDIAISLGGEKVAYVAPDEAIQVRDTRRCQEIEARFDNHLVDDQNDAVGRLAFSKQSELLSSASLHGLVLVWELTSKRELYRLTPFSHGVEALAFSPNGHLLAIGGSRNSGETFNPDTGEVFRAAEPPRAVIFLDMTTGAVRDTVLSLSDTGPIWSLAFATDGKRIAVGSSDTTSVWQLEGASNPTHRFEHGGMTKSVAFSSDGQSLITATPGSIIIWNLQQDRRVREIVAHSDALLIDTAVRNQDGILATASTDGRVLLWNLANGRNLGAGLSHESLAFSPRLVFSRGAESAVVLAHPQGVDRRRLNPEHLMQLACARANRNLTESEWAEYMGTGVKQHPTCEFESSE